MRFFEYRHVVGFEDTNIVGNVYYVNHVSWQGRCREMFLRTHCPDVVALIAGGLRLVTLRVSCDYLDELTAFDEVCLRMHLIEQRQNRITLGFQYFREHPDTERLVAKGMQEVAAMRLEGAELTATPLPASLQEALRNYSDRV